MAILVVSCGKIEPQLSSDELNSRVNDFYAEIEGLDTQLQSLSGKEEYILTNGEGQELVPADVLDFSSLIKCMTDLEPYVYFVLLSSFMEESGYEVENKSLQEISDEFFSLPDDDKSIVLSKMFGYVGEEQISDEASKTTQIYILRAFQLMDKSTGEPMLGD